MVADDESLQDNLQMGMSECRLISLVLLKMPLFRIAKRKKEEMIRTVEQNMYFCAAEKQIRTVFVLDSPPLARIRRSKTLKKPIIMLWQKISPAYFSESRWGGNIEKGRLNTQ